MQKENPVGEGCTGNNKFVVPYTEKTIFPFPFTLNGIKNQKIKTLLILIHDTVSGYDRGDSFPFDFEPNGNPFGSKSKGFGPQNNCF